MSRKTNPLRVPANPQGAKTKNSDAFRADGSTRGDSGKPFINGQAWKQSGYLRLKAPELKVLLGFMAFENAKSRTAYPGDKAVAKLLGVDERTVERCKRKLIASGIMAIKRRAHPVYGTQEFSFEVPASIRGQDDPTILSGGELNDPTDLSGGKGVDPTNFVERPDKFCEMTRQICPPNAVSNSSSECQDQNQDQNPSPDGGEKQKPIGSENEQRGGVVLENSDLLSKEKIQPSSSETKPSIDENEIVTLPAPPSDFDLTPPPKKELQRADPRHVEFRGRITARYEVRWKRPCTWKEAEGKQLKIFLDARPWLDAATFTTWLVNYFASHNITPSEPRRFIPILDKYSAGPLDQYGKLEYDSSEPAEDEEVQKRSSLVCLRPDDAVDTCGLDFAWIVVRDGVFKCTAEIYGEKGHTCAVAESWRKGTGLPRGLADGRAIFERQQPFLDPVKAIRLDMARALPSADPDADAATA